MIVTTGKNFIVNKLTGESNNPLTNANCYIGVGTSNAAAAVGNTSLTGEVRAKCDSGYPQAPSGSTGTVTVVYRATFASDVANQAWNEWGIFNAASGNQMLNRVVTNNGVKASGQTWVFTITVTYRRA